MPYSNHKLLIANRGEIAVRIIRAAQQLGIDTVAVCSEADKMSLPAQLADEVVIIGPARSDQSYLKSELILKAAKETGATAIHPGYGFLSENADFAEAVVKAGMIFVGPSADTIRQMGDKSCARTTAQAAGVPVVPGSNGEIDSLEEAITAAQDIGYPLLIKASAGGGGRGIRIAHNPEELATELVMAQSEAKAAFGSGSVYLERFIQQARHIEVQILGDGVNAIHLYERECSLQRRRQKIFEEAPSPALSDTAREILCLNAAKLAQNLHYKGAGTLEFLYDDITKEFFFIEMNTRIQVEHPISEAITGIDLVQWMIKIALGEPLSLKQENININGWAIEMRINAENPEKGFFPSPGQLKELIWPVGEGIRIDTHLFDNYVIPPYYDSLLAKIIVHGDTRQQAFERASNALDNTKIEGVVTTLALHKLLLKDQEIQAGNFHTETLETWLSNHLEKIIDLEKAHANTTH
ncbi:MAG: acetyl-CoA carboxylase biotin carboxylase subunit [Marinomonas sp.]